MTGNWAETNLCQLFLQSHPSCLSLIWNLLSFNFDALSLPVKQCSFVFQATLMSSRDIQNKKVSIKKKCEKKSPKHKNLFYCCLCIAHLPTLMTLVRGWTMLFRIEAIGAIFSFLWYLFTKSSVMLSLNVKVLSSRAFTLLGKECFFVCLFVSLASLMSSRDIQNRKVRIKKIAKNIPRNKKFNLLLVLCCAHINFDAPDEGLHYDI